jgi:hypothetical protein
MTRGPCNHHLGSGIVVLVVAMLALAGCNSGSGSSQKTSGAPNTITGAQTPQAAPTTGKATLFDALAGKSNGSQ